MYITKKDLLAQTGISYGQLYRWKREGLIPEEWFIKKASHTGQETYLPKEQILARISFILENKEQHSLEELADMLCIQPSRKEFNRQKLKEMKEIHPDIVNTLKDGEYSRAEVAFLAIASDICWKFRLNRAEISEFIVSCSGAFSSLAESRHVFLVFRYAKRLFGILAQEGAEPVMDSRFELAGRYQVEEIVNGLVLKYTKTPAFAK